LFANNPYQNTMTRYKLIFYVPISHANKVKQAVFATGAGALGAYKHCAFQTKGEGQFLPLEGATPAIGEQGKLEIVEEFKVEILCLDEANTKDAVREMKNAHPYEEVAYEVYKVEDF
jgi:structural toxin protein (hemagglutinin/hemolysin) RtxA